MKSTAIMNNTVAIYARKSSESEDRQILSIDSQVKELRDLANSQGIRVKHVFSESRSAKSPGRPVFSDLLDSLGAGKVSGLICWKLDRLARNPIDGAALIWAMEEGRLKEIVTPGRTFLNTGNDKFWMQLEFGMAKKYVDDLSDNVKRGNRAKLERGWLPGPAPIGYLNDRNSKTIVPDPARFRLVRRIWDLILDGRRAPQILETANDKWALRTPPLGRHGGTKLSRSSLYRILSNPFYYGLIARNQDTYPGAHKPMISQAEFMRVQEILGRPNRQPLPKREFTYTGLITCGACNLSVTAERKTNPYGSRYVYYHCTHRRPRARCQQPSIRVEALERQITSELHRLRLRESIEAWLLDHIEGQVRDRGRSTDQEIENLKQALARIGHRLTTLTDLRLDGHISEGEFLAKRRSLVAEQLNLKAQLTQKQLRPAQTFELSKNAILFGKYAAKRFASGSTADRRAILSTVGSNFFLKDKILLTQYKKPFQAIAETASNPNWRATWDAIRTYFEHNPDAIQWPAWFEKKIKNHPKINKTA